MEMIMSWWQVVGVVLLRRGISSKQVSLVTVAPTKKTLVWSSLKQSLTINKNNMIKQSRNYYPEKEKKLNTWLYEE